MKRLTYMALTAALIASMAFAQAGPEEGTKKKKKKARPDTTQTEAQPAKEKNEKKGSESDAPKAAANGDSTRAAGTNSESTAEKPTKKAPNPTKEADKETKGSPPRLSDAVPRAVFALGIEAHEPVNPVDSLSTDTERVHFFTELVGMQGATVTHRWRYDGKVRAEVPIRVRSARYRAFSSKRMLPSWTGRWTAEVVDSTGGVLAARQFTYFTTTPAADD